MQGEVWKERRGVQGCRKFQTVQYNKIFKPKLSDEKCVILRHFATFYKVCICKNFIFKLFKCPTI